MRLFGNGTFTHTRFVGPANPLTKSWPNASRTWLRRLEFGTLFFVEMYLVWALCPAVRRLSSSFPVLLLSTEVWAASLTCTRHLCPSLTAEHVLTLRIDYTPLQSRTQLYPFRACLA